MKIFKINGKLNPADLGTKALSKEEIDKYVKMASCYYDNEAGSMYSVLFLDCMHVL